MFTLIIVFTFASLALMVMSVYWIFARPQSTVTARLESMDPSLALVENSPVTTMAEKVAEPLNRIVPISALEALKLQKKMLQAGYRSPDAAMAFRAVQISLTLAVPSIVMTVCFLFDGSLNSFLVLSLLGAGIGFYLPRLVLSKIITNRQLRITWGLADALDLLVVAVEAGLGLNAALNRVGDELKNNHPDLHNELDIVNLEIRVGRSREEALRNLAERTGVEDIRSFVALLIQADRYGSSIAKAVRIFAESLRTKRRQRAEQASQKAALKLIFPLTACLFPVIILVILAPAVLNIIDLLFK
ncbi:MAG TPA: type II secretion system F family protein [Pyrinomonadaceae bacterium]|jgi:tight adherence protein C|nr:type II secretion system F family protein [Pyrinomonadaceae bacterium]